MLRKYLKYFFVTYALMYCETIPLRDSGLRSLKDFSKRGFSTVLHMIDEKRRRWVFSGEACSIMLGPAGR